MFVELLKVQLLILFHLQGVRALISFHQSLATKPAPCRASTGASNRETTPVHFTETSHHVYRDGPPYSGSSDRRN